MLAHVTQPMTTSIRINDAGFCCGLGEDPVDHQEAPTVEHPRDERNRGVCRIAQQINERR